jgi:PAS domain S-box-containing protein
VPLPFLTGLRGRLLLILLLAILPALALTLYTGWDDRQHQQAGVKSDTVALARIVANDNERIIEATRQTLSDLAGMPEVRAGVAVRCQTLFALLMKQSRGYASFSVIAPTGEVLTSFPPVERPVNLADRPWFQRATASRESTVGEYQMGQLTGKPVVVVAWPALDDTGALVSVVAAALDVSWLNQIASTARLPAGSQLVLVDRRGVVVARYPETAGLVGRGLTETALAGSMQREEEGVVESTGEDGVARVYGFTAVRGRVDTGLRLAIGIPQSVAYGAVRKAEVRHLLALAMVMVLTLAGGWFGAERLVLRRVASLLDATRKLAAGDPGARTSLPYGHGELSDLARSFDDMASALQARQAERDQAEQALRESEERFRAFMDNSPALALIKDRDGRVVYANATFERHFGLQPGGWRDQSDDRFWSGESAERFRRQDAEVLASGEPRQSVDRVTVPDGRRGHWLTVKFPLSDARGQRLVATMSFDLTEWRRAQEELARAERRYSELVEQASDGIVMADSELHLVAVNSAACRMSGYERDELLRRSVQELIWPEDLTARPIRLKELREGGGIVTERRIRRKDGSPLPVEISAQALEDGGVQAIVRDVSQRRAVEEALRESEERFRLLYQYLPLAYQSLAENGTIVLVNDAWLALMRLGRAQAIGRPFVDLLAPASARIFEAALARAASSGEVHDAELTLERGDRTLVTVSLDGRRGRDEQGHVRIHCALHDVTAARQAEARIRESEERYRTLFADSPISLWEEDFSGIRRHVDRLRALGVTDVGEHLAANPEELADCVEAVKIVDVNRAGLALYGAENRSQLLAGLDRIIGLEGHEVYRRSIVALASGERSWTSEGVNYSLNGDPIRLALQWSLAPGAERTWSRVLVSAMDITGRTLAEDAARESEAKFERVFRSAPDIMGISRRRDWCCLDVNDAFLRELGFTLDQVIGRSPEDLGLWASPSDRAATAAALADRGFLHGWEVRLRRRSGGVLEGLLSAAPIQVKGEECLLLQVVDTTARRHAEEAGRESQRMLSTLMSNLPGMVSQRCVDPEWTVLFVSDGCRDLTGYEPSDIIGNRRVSYGSLIADEDRDAAQAEVRQAVSERRPFRLTYRLRHANGDLRWVQEQGRGVQSPTDQVITLEGFATDISERKRAEEELQRNAEQLRQAQKMEAVGRLAGGIAHDFNNLLTAILGYSDLVLSRLSPTDPIVSRVEEIRRAGERAANLTRKLLAFSRNQVLAPTVLVLDTLLEEMVPMLRRLIGEDIELRVVAGRAGNIKADPTQIEQVVMNLVVNARDAMPSGGQLTIETAPLELDASRGAAWPDIEPGSYATFEVTDTGVGMDEATRLRLFEPFFTTKAKGKGTGLGLSTVYGIVKQSGGFVTVESQKGRGTTFRIGLPHTGESLEDAAPGSPPSETAGGHETILVAEDEDAVRQLIRAILERLGYAVLEARNGDEALALWREKAGGIDLLLTDVVMPRTNGPALAALVRATDPGARIIFMSGHMDEAIVGRGALPPGTPLLRKPFTSLALANLVRTVLDSPITA